jgi:hypothetical protein
LYLLPLSCIPKKLFFLLIRSFNVISYLAVHTRAVGQKL